MTSRHLRPMIEAMETTCAAQNQQMEEKQRTFCSPERVRGTKSGSTTALTGSECSRLNILSSLLDQRGKSLERLCLMM